MRITLMWFAYCLKWLLGKRRFLSFLPPLFHKQFVYDSKTGKIHKINIRDIDDWIQLEHIFLNEEFRLNKTGRESQINTYYQGILGQGKMPLIIDLGANIGFASKYFSLIYPLAKVLAVEPDAGNCEIFRQNLHKDALLFNAAISFETGSAELIHTGRNCAFRVEKNIGGAVILMTVPELLEVSPSSIPFLIKIDIEGFESELFAKNTDWIDLFPILLIELHDWMLPNSNVTKNFLNEIANRNREFMHFDGYVVSISNTLFAFKDPKLS